MSGRPVKLDAREVERALEHLPSWRLEEGALAREYEFKDFQTAFAFMGACAKVAEELDHHPDWSNSYNKVEVRLRTHDQGGITRLDLELARRMEALREC